MRRFKFRRTGSVVAILATLASSIAVAPALSSGALTAPPTLTTLKTLVSASTYITVAPNLGTTVPLLTSLKVSTASITPQRTACYNSSPSPTVPAIAMTECAYGSIHSTKVMFLIGDSQAGMWLPALNQIGLRTGWRVVFLAKSGCGPWGNPNPSGYVIYNGITVADCRTYNTNVANFAKAHRPQAIVIVGRGYPMGSMDFHLPVLSTLESEMAAELATLKLSGARLITITPIPRYIPAVVPYAPVDCLLQTTPFVNCQKAPSKIIPQVELSAIKAESSLGRTRMADVTPMFCSATKCTIVVNDHVNNRLVFNNGTHINNTYSVWLNVALGQILKPLLP